MKLADVGGLRASAGPQSKKRGKLRGIGLSNTIERAAARVFEGAEIRFDRARHGARSSRAAINQGQGHETIFKQIVADKLGIDPDDIEYIQGDTDKVFFGEGTGGSRSATMSAARRSTWPSKSDRPRPSRSPRTSSRSTSPTSSSTTASSRAPKTNRTHRRSRKWRRTRIEPAEAAEGHGGRPVPPPRSTRADVENFPNGVPHLRGRDRSGDRRVEIVQLQRGRRRRHRASTRCC